MANENELILVDIFDQPIGTGEKEAVHQKGLLHRAFSVFVCHDGKMLVHRRNPNKYHSGGLWTNACCSHPRAGKTLEQSVEERLQEELGVSFPVEELFHFVYRSVFENERIEYEFDHVFIADYAGDFAPDPEEIAELKWIDFEELKEDLTHHPERYSVWFQIAAPRVLEMQKNPEGAKEETGHPGCKKETAEK